MKDTYCSHCGAPFRRRLNKQYPKTCECCDQITWRNPIPVAVVLLPVEDGLLVGRRGINPGKGEWGLPGGYIEYGEHWKDAATRELREEIGLNISPLELKLFDIFSSLEHILIFCIAPIQSNKVIQDFVVNEETAEVLKATEPMDLAFQSHTTMMHRFFRNA